MILLVRNPQNFVERFRDSQLCFLGWGSTSEDGSLSSQLQKVTIPFVSDSGCL